MIEYYVKLNSQTTLHFMYYQMTGTLYIKKTKVREYNINNSEELEPFIKDYLWTRYAHSWNHENQLSALEKMQNELKFTLMDALKHED